VTRTTPSKYQQRLATEPQWSKYQLAVFDWIENGTGHAQIDAVAGSGKSTSLLGIVNRIKCSRQPTATWRLTATLLRSCARS